MKMRIHIPAESSSVMKIFNSSSVTPFLLLLVMKASFFLPGTCIGGKLSYFLITVSGRVPVSR